jgi:XTP/dITP diphosphohydrolase
VSTWLLATRNRGTLAELIPMLERHGVTAVTLDEAGVVAHPEEEAIEAFPTFEANALAKARYFAARTGMPCLADDSGLCIDALDGAPGIRSRRFAADRNQSPLPGTDEDAANNDAMIDACWDSGRAPPWTARYVCAAAFCDNATAVVATGQTRGHITPERDGAGGFGYDPFFVSDDLGMSFARASRDAKAGVSHRGRAFAALLAQLAPLRT